MFRKGSTRRTFFAAGLAGGVVVGGGGALANDDVEDLERRVRHLESASAAVDYDDPAAERRLYQAAAPVMAAVLGHRAICLRGLRVKARALTWCLGGPLQAGPDAPIAERVAASLLDDLLAA